MPALLTEESVLCKLTEEALEEIRACESTSIAPDENISREPASVRRWPDMRTPRLLPMLFSCMRSPSTMAFEDTRIFAEVSELVLAPSEL